MPDVPAQRRVCEVKHRAKASLGVHTCYLEKAAVRGPRPAESPGIEAGTL